MNYIIAYAVLNYIKILGSINMRIMSYIDT